MTLAMSFPLFETQVLPVEYGKRKEKKKEEERRRRRKKGGGEEEKKWLPGCL